MPQDFQNLAETMALLEYTLFLFVDDTIIKSMCTYKAASAVLPARFYGKESGGRKSWLSKIHGVIPESYICRSSVGILNQNIFLQYCTHFIL